MKIRKGIPLLVIFLFGYLYPSVNTVDIPNITKKIDRVFEKFNRFDSPGAAVLVQLHGRNIYKKCFGLANLEHHIPIEPESSFDLASVSKHLTSFAVLLLEKDGKLDLDDDIRRYLPELPDYNTKITIRHLLYQSSGLWEFWTILNKYSGFRDRDYFKMIDVLNLLRHQGELVFNPGTKYAYTNTNYSLLAEIIKRLTGVSFGEWTKKNLFDPLEMENTYFQEDCTIPIPKKATAYLKRDGRYVLARPSNVEIPGSAHAFTTLNDMAKWIDNFRTGKLGGKTVLRKMFTRGTLDNGKEIAYAAGLIVGRHEGVEIIEHSGQTGGYKTMLVYCPEKELGIVILANERSINAYDLSHRILGICLGNGDESKSIPDQSGDNKSIKLDASVLNNILGGYRIEGTNELLGLYRDGNFVFGSILGRGNKLLLPVSETRFVDYSGKFEIHFLTNESGQVNQATMVLHGDTLVAHKTQLDTEISPKEFTGSYYCRELGSICAVLEKNRELILSPQRNNDIKLYCLEPNSYVGAWGFMSFNRDGNGRVNGFTLKDELFGFKGLFYSKVRDESEQL